LLERLHGFVCEVEFCNEHLRLGRVLWYLERRDEVVRVGFLGIAVVCMMHVLMFVTSGKLRFPFSVFVLSSFSAALIASCDCRVFRCSCCRSLDEQLPSMGVDANSIKFGSCTMESDKFITVCEAAAPGGQTNVVMIDLAAGNTITRRPMAAEAAIMNPVSKVIALRGRVAYCDHDLGTRKMAQGLWEHDVALDCWSQRDRPCRSSTWSCARR
jgi:hypothetical protein